MKKDPLKFRNTGIAIVLFIWIICIFLLAVTRIPYFAIPIGAATLGYLVLSFFFWKCPHCKEYLPLFFGLGIFSEGGDNIKTCPYCGATLSESSEEEN